MIKENDERWGGSTRSGDHKRKDDCCEDLEFHVDLSARVQVDALHCIENEFILLNWTYRVLRSVQYSYRTYESTACMRYVPCARQHI